MNSLKKLNSKQFKASNCRINIMNRNHIFNKALNLTHQEVKGTVASLEAGHAAAIYTADGHDLRFFENLHPKPLPKERGGQKPQCVPMLSVSCFKVST
jgi:hypothetical protein